MPYYSEELGLSSLGYRYLSLIVNLKDLALVISREINPSAQVPLTPSEFEEQIADLEADHLRRLLEVVTGSVSSRIGPVPVEPRRIYNSFVVSLRACLGPQLLVRAPGISNAFETERTPFKSTRPTWNDVVGKGHPLFRDLEMPIERLQEFGASEKQILALKSKGVDYFWQLRKMNKALRKIKLTSSLRRVPEDSLVEIRGLRGGESFNFRESLNFIVIQRLAYSQATPNQALVLDSLNEGDILHCEIYELGRLEEYPIGRDDKLGAAHIYFFWQLIGYSEQGLKVLGLEAREVRNIKALVDKCGLELNFNWDEAAEKIRQVLSTRVDEFNFSARTTIFLHDAGIEYIWQLAEKTKAALSKLPNFDRKHMLKIEIIFAGLGLPLGMRGEEIKMRLAKDQIAAQSAESASLAAHPKIPGGGTSHGNPTIHQGWESHFHARHTTHHALRSGLHRHMAPDAHFWASGGVMAGMGASSLGIMEALVP